MKTIVQVFEKSLKSNRKPYMLRVERNFHMMILKYNLLKIKENLSLQRDLFRNFIWSYKYMTTNVRTVLVYKFDDT